MSEKSFIPCRYYDIKYIITIKICKNVAMLIETFQNKRNVLTAISTQYNIHLFYQFNYIKFSTINLL